MPVLSIVIPALNEAENLPKVAASIPRAELAALGWETEIILVDNASTDDTGTIARGLGMTVVYQPDRGYGNAYLAGIAAARGSVIATGDADCTYPFEDLPRLLGAFVADRLDFLNTDRLSQLRIGSMSPHHIGANLVFTGVTKVLFRSPFRDSQSGMWLFTQDFWRKVSVRSPGMAFSQEIKMAAHVGGFRVAEIPIDYRIRGGEKKLNSLSDGMRNMSHLFVHRAKVARWQRRARQLEAATTGNRGYAVRVPFPRRSRQETQHLTAVAQARSVGVTSRPGVSATVVFADAVVPEAVPELDRQSATG
ncbi:glycosyltransferase family 2 protein [Frankia sp. R82]|uniref:glycosyltransferase family 2 protein n=1 Tax=Frankia sp. R82 TaxID=2950553 RepID=UPI002042F584|nr:glycosyltransferase family 2 protein [Frankia sp. R82]MCM3884954.1 glycosyltransferase family 2 protein [Frankia sp. R82]